MKKEKIELVVVFKKQTSKETAEQLLEQAGVNYRSGMDSSRGKLYFYSTGPKYILTFETLEKQESARGEFGKAAEVHEVYKPDWSKCKD